MIICGVDEAGRGPLAGPVTAAAVILGDDVPGYILQDSKKLSPGKRKEHARILANSSSRFSIGWVWPEEIDAINIHFATLLAMKRALYGLTRVPDRVLVDGKFIPETEFPAEAVIRGDSFVPEIQAASIIAKVARDRWMECYHLVDVRYDFSRHKGYPTKRHRALIAKYGLSQIHRKSFRTDYSS